MQFPTDPLNLIICGIGGQGNIRLSRMIGKILNGKGYHVSIGETFGAAQRGGSVYSSMRVSKTTAYGPLIPDGRAHMVLSLEPLEALRVLGRYGNPDVACIVNGRPVLPVGVLGGQFDYPDPDRLLKTIEGLSRDFRAIDATGLALGLGAPIVANIIMLGLLAESGIIPVDLADVREEVENSFPEAVVDLNLRALALGAGSAG